MIVTEMHGVIRLATPHADGVILCAEHGPHFAKEGDHWRCVEYPDLLMLPGERY